MITSHILGHFPENRDTVDSFWDIPGNVWDILLNVGTFFWDTVPYSHRDTSLTVGTFLNLDISLPPSPIVLCLLDILGLYRLGFPKTSVKKWDIFGLYWISQKYLGHMSARDK